MQLRMQGCEFLNQLENAEKKVATRGHTFYFVRLENLRQQLKIYADIEDSFQRIRQQENRDRAVEESRRRVETQKNALSPQENRDRAVEESIRRVEAQNNALSPQENRDRAVKESIKRVEAQNSPVSPSTTNIPKGWHNKNAFIIFKKFLFDTG